MDEHDIIQKADNRLMDVIRSYLPEMHFQPVGKVQKAKCPFFSEEETRFYVWPEKRCWICYGGINERGGALQFVVKLKKCSRKEALSELESMFSSSSYISKARVEKVEAVHEFLFEEKEEFPVFELSLLGNLKRTIKKHDGTFEEMDTINSADLMRAFPIRSLRSFTYPAREGCSYSWKVYSTEEFPIMYWCYQRPDGSKWGKIYQPKAEKGKRFSYFGTKEKNFLFSDEKTAAYLQRIKRGEEIEAEKKIENLVIVSGGSDAINTYFNGGFNTCWLNSETDILEPWQHSRLRSIAKNIVVLYDMDDTGKKYAYKMAIRYMDINLALLPEEMYRESKGTCKDVKDFFIKWNSSQQRMFMQEYFGMNKFEQFGHIVKNALPLKFWMDKMKQDGSDMKKVGVEIDNEQLYRFLSAYGICKYAYDNEEYKYVRIRENIVEEIGEKKISGVINQLLRDFIKRTPIYFDKELLNAINRSNQVKGQSLQNISEIKLNFTYNARHQEFLFFRNGALRITENEMEMVPLESLPFHLYADKIINADFHLEKEPIFQVEYSEKYLTCEEDKNFPPLEKFVLRKNWGDFSYAQFVYNTGEVYWREKELGFELSEMQMKEPELNFVSKICALGYVCRKHKEMDKAYMLMCVEDENNKNGEHNGGVGKSLFYYPLRQVRNLWFRDGQLVDPKKDSDLLYFGVVPGKTDIVHFDDLQKGFPLNMLFNQITGDMTVRKRFGDAVTIPFHESPVTVLNSNHKPADIDPSKRRRTWFCTFSSYYHPANPNMGIPERKPINDFGKNIVDDYTPEEMNKLYFFFAQCIQTYMRINQKVLPVMDRVERGMLINSISQNVFDWMNDYFDDAAEISNKLNVAIWKNDIFEDFKQIYSRTVQDRITVTTLKEKLQKYCEFKHWTFNPPVLYRNDNERKRGEYRKSRDGKDDFFWYIQTCDIPQETMDAFAEKTVEPITTLPEGVNTGGRYPYPGENTRNEPKQYKMSQMEEKAPF